MTNEASMPNEKWEKCNTKVFWGEIAPTDHLIQIYESDETILNTLESFICSGFECNDSVVIIATRQHIIGLNQRIRDRGYDVSEMRSKNLYIPLDAHRTLSKFMRNDWPDEVLFNLTVKEIINASRAGSDRNVRAYGEMVAILWEKGHNGATVQLEHLWNKFCAKEAFCLFCAYPKSGFTQSPESSLDHICSAHTKVIGAFDKSTTEIHYKNSNLKNKSY